MATNKKLDEDLLMAFPSETDMIKSFNKMIRAVPENRLHIYPLTHPRWEDSGDPTVYGMDAFNFNAFPAGYRNSFDSTYVDLGYTALFGVTDITTNNFVLSDAYNTYLTDLYGSVGIDYTIGRSVRLFRLATSPELLYSDGTIINNVFTDYDGNVYSGCKIGTQIWTRENLKVTHLANGTIIPTNFNDVDWANLTTKGYSTPQENGYGLLYNYYALSGLISDTNWHVPSSANFTTLINYIVSLPAWSNGFVGMSLKSTRQVNSPYPIK